MRKTGKKRDRLNLIKEYVRYSKVRTQEELLKYLQVQGYDVTQATISRDIADMGLTKNRAGYYALVTDEELRTIFKTLVTAVNHSANIVLVKTLPASAQTVARFLDSADVHGILGSVAGDDTIFLLIAENVPSRAVVKKLLDLKN